VKPTDASVAAKRKELRQAYESSLRSYVSLLSATAAHIRGELLDRLTTSMGAAVRVWFSSSTSRHSLWHRLQESFFNAGAELMQAIRPQMVTLRTELDKERLDQINKVRLTTFSCSFCLVRLKAPADVV
jgi:hypothetical protein